VALARVLWQQGLRSRAVKAQKRFLPCAAGPGPPTRVSRGGVEIRAQRSAARLKTISAVPDTTLFSMSRCPDAPISRLHRRYFSTGRPKHNTYPLLSLARQRGCSVSFAVRKEEVEDRHHGRHLLARSKVNAFNQNGVFTRGRCIFAIAEKNYRGLGGLITLQTKGA
jgi:hypothetical protein